MVQHTHPRRRGEVYLVAYELEVPPPPLLEPHACTTMQQNTRERRCGRVAASHTRTHLNHSHTTASLTAAVARTTKSNHQTEQSSAAKHRRRSGGVGRLVQSKRGSVTAMTPAHPNRPNAAPPAIVQRCQIHIHDLHAIMRCRRMQHSRRGQRGGHGAAKHIPPSHCMVQPARARRGPSAAPTSAQSCYITKSRNAWAARGYVAKEHHDTRIASQDKRTQTPATACGCEAAAGSRTAVPSAHILHILRFVRYPENSTPSPAFSSAMGT
jgi:hypothetical protein